MEIQVGDYVRTKEGIIGKAVSEYGNTIRINLQNGECWGMSKSNFEGILKHSKNIIDLIEVKDLVNFKNTLPNLPEYLENKEMIIHIFDNDTLEEIKEAIKKEEIELVSIVTHQQFKQVEYEV